LLTDHSWVTTERSRLIQVYQPDLTIGQEMEGTARSFIERVRRETRRIYRERIAG